MAAAFVKIFHWKVDFRRDMRPGATFAVIYQQLMHNGKEAGQGPIEAAELINAGKALRVYRYETARGATATTRQGGIRWSHPYCARRCTTLVSAPLFPATAGIRFCISGDHTTVWI
jgi:hypothetical protein